MNKSRPCPICSAPIVGRRDKQQCSPACKQVAKRAYDIDRYESIRTQTVARAVAWQKANPLRKQEYDRGYRNRDRERKLALKRSRSRVYHLQKPESAVYSSSRRRARIAENPLFEVTRRDYARLLNRFGNACAYCHAKFSSRSEIEWDHVIPVSRGGGHSIANLLPACRSCNRNKSVRFIMEWKMQKVVSKPSQQRAKSLSVL